MFDRAQKNFSAFYMERNIFEPIQKEKNYFYSKYWHLSSWTQTHIYFFEMFKKIYQTVVCYGFINKKSIENKTENGNTKIARHRKSEIEMKKKIK